MFRPTLTLPLLILATMTISSAQTTATLPSSGCDCASLARIDAPEPAQKAADSVSPLLLRPSPSVSEDIPPAPSSNADMSPAAPNNKKLSWRKTLGSKAVLRQVLRSVATQYTLVRMGMGSGLMNIPAPVPANANGMPLPPGLPGPQGPIQNVYPAIATNVPYGYAPQGPGALPPTQGPVVASSTGVGLTPIPWQVSQPGIAPAAPTEALPTPSVTVPVVRIEGGQVQRFALPDGRILVLFPDGAVGIQGTLNPAGQSGVPHPESANPTVPHK